MVKYYTTIMKRVGSRCDLQLFKGQQHGFFNYGNKKYYIKTITEVDLFLQSLGFLSEFQNIKINDY